MRLRGKMCRSGECNCLYGGAKTSGLVEDIRQMLGDVEPENFPDRLLFVSMCNDIGWNRKGYKKKLERSSEFCSAVSSRTPDVLWTRKRSQLVRVAVCASRSLGSACESPVRNFANQTDDPILACEVPVKFGEKRNASRKT